MSSSLEIGLSIFRRVVIAFVSGVLRQQPRSGRRPRSNPRRHRALSGRDRTDVLFIVCMVAVLIDQRTACDSSCRLRDGDGISATVVGIARNRCREARFAGSGDETRIAVVDSPRIRVEKAKPEIRIDAAAGSPGG